MVEIKNDSPFGEWYKQNQNFVEQFLDGKFSLIQKNVEIPLYRRSIFGTKESPIVSLPLHNLPKYMTDWVRSIKIRLDRFSKYEKTEVVGGMVIKHEPIDIAHIIGLIEYKRFNYRTMNFQSLMTEREILTALDIPEIAIGIAFPTPIFQLKKINLENRFIIIGPSDKPVTDTLEAKRPF